MTLQTSDPTPPADEMRVRTVRCFKRTTECSERANVNDRVLYNSPNCVRAICQSRYVSLWSLFDEPLDESLLEAQR